MISSLQATRHMNLNSGLFYTQSNQRTIGLMDRIAARLAKEAAWDQSVFNEEIFFLSHDDYVSPNISVRVMNYHKVSESMRTRLHGFGCFATAHAQQLHARACQPAVPAASCAFYSLEAAGP